MAPSHVSFAFVSVTSSAPELDAQSRGLIKKHVMKNIGFARRRFKSKEARDTQSQKVLSTPNASGYTLSHKPNTSGLTEDEPTVKSIADLEHLIHFMQPSKPNTIIGVGCIDPFDSLPIPGDMGVDTLINHINDDTHASFKLFREYWFPLAIQDPAAFHCTLALAAQHLMTLYPQHSKEKKQRTGQYVSHYAAAIRCVKDRVGDPTQNTSDEMIAAILTLACDHASSNAATNYLQHMDGLDAIIQLRGGVETLESNKNLRLLLFWIDTMGSSALNISPRFPAPTRYLPNYDSAFRGQSRPRLPGRVSEEWAVVFPSHIELIMIFDDLCALTIMVEKEALEKQAIQDPRFTGFYILPLIHRLFMLRLERTAGHQENMVFEACKLSAFLYLQQLRHFVALRYPCLRSPFFESRQESSVTLTSCCVLRLEMIMLGHDVVWTTLQSLKCWALTIGANASYMIPNRPIDLVDLAILAILATSPLYHYWLYSMDPLMKNSWTHVFYKAM